MALWGSEDLANNAPKHTIVAGVSANGQQMYGNTQVSAFVTNEATGVFGVDTTEAGVTSGEGKKVAHAGWNLRKAGIGPVISVTANTGAYSPDGNIYLSFTGGGSNTAANAQIVTDGTKKIVSITLNTGGSYEVTPTATATNANAVFTITMGGRANRIHYETLVAMGSMSVGGNTDDTIFPDS